MALVVPFQASIPRAEPRRRCRSAWLSLAALPLGARLPVRPGGWPTRLPVRRAQPGGDQVAQSVRLRAAEKAMAGYRVSFAPDVHEPKASRPKLLARTQTEGPQRLQEAAEAARAKNELSPKRFTIAAGERAESFAEQLKGRCRGALGMV